MTGEPGVTRSLRSVDREWLSIPVALLVAGLVAVYAPVAGDMARMLAITLFCIVLWVASPFDPWLTGLIGVGLIGVGFSTDLALVGFRSPATWLVLLGILLGEAIGQSGLASVVERRAIDVLPRGAATDATVAYRYLLVALSAAALGLVVLVPSSLVRVLILGPILISVGGSFSERRPGLGLFLGPLFVTYYAGTGVLTGSLANIIITGLLEANAGVSIGWVEWAVWLGPVMGVGRAVAITAIAYVLYRPRPDTTIDLDGEPADEDAAAADVRRMLLYMLLGVAIWATDAIHGLHPLYGALVVSVLAFAPRIGVVSPESVSDGDFSIVFFLGAIFAIAEGLRRTEFTDLAARAILESLPGDASLLLVLPAVILAAMALAFLMEGLAVASVLTPVLVSFAESAGLPLVPVAMIEAVALNTYFLPYQSAVLVGILGLNYVGSRELIKMATLCSLATLLVLMPVQVAIFVVAF